MFFKRILAFTLLAALLPLSTAQAEVKWPYVLDTDFSDNGYDTQAASGAQKLAMDGEDTIVAVTTTVSGSDEVDVELLRYSASGQLKPWSGGATHLPILTPGDAGALILAVGDLQIDQHGDLHLLLDVRANGNTHSDTWLLSMASNGVVRGMRSVSHTAASETGRRILIRGNRLFALVMGDTRWTKLSAYDLAENTAPAVATGWGVNGARTYSAVLCATPEPAICNTNATHLVTAPGPIVLFPTIQDTSGFYIGGSIERHIGYPSTHDMFLLKLDADGLQVTTYGNNGWYLWGTDQEDHMAGLQIIRTDLPLTGKHDVLALSAMKRACGEGIIISRRSGADGSQISRTFTHGGGSSGTSCDSILARDMVLTSGNRLAVVGTYVSPVLLNTNAAMLLTFNPDTLNDSQDVQTLLGGGSGAIAPSYGFNAIAQHPTRNRLMAVGNGSQFTIGAGWRGVALISALKEKPLFSDGFED
ncbi:hypothetical protein OS187_04605 [Xanthomonadaceae bacterium JHOS43]|nr:hypothetical protein [Xanthomonadaceae bacterium JHOS43]